MAVCAWSAEPMAADIAQAVKDATLDPDACFRVRDLNFAKEDVRFYLADGFLIFAKPVLGQRLFAVFSGDVEGGDAEVLLFPPHRSERRSLNGFAGSPNLNEHFKTALLLFSDGTGDELFNTASESGHKNVEMGALMKDRWTSLARNISSGFESRLVEDVLSPDRSTGIFFSALAGDKVGNFDIVHDPTNREQILVGQYTTRGVTPTFDVWTSFQSKSVRSGRRKPAEPKFTLSDYRIDVTLDATLRMQAITRAKLTARTPLRAVELQVSDKVQIQSVSLDGNPIQLYTRESDRDAAMRGGGNTTFLAIAPEPIDPGRPHDIEIRHEGNVVVPAGNDVFYVTSRGNWYPRSGMVFTTYDMTFRYPKRLTMVATGDVAEDRTEGETRITRRKTSVPVRVAGFNLGAYARVKLERSGYSIEVFGNQALEPSLQPKTPMVIMPPMPRSMGRRPDVFETVPPVAAIKPTSHLAGLAENAASAFEFMRSEFGPPPLKTLTVSPIPGAFGQGFPGLVYLSTLAYLRQEERPPALRSREDEIFFSELLPAHEVAHQWWGNTVAVASYQDEWLMEALASYSSLLYLEKRRGPKAVESLLEIYLSHLMNKMEDGRTTESAGPITLGLRLQSSQTEGAWRVITYEKGAWILHMLRRRMGDENFHKFLGELCRRYAHEPLDTEQFRKVAESMMGPKAGNEPLAEFFESWVYGTGIPALKMNYALRGKAPALKLTGSVTQSGVDEDFTVEVPIDVYSAKGSATTVWVRTSNEPATFSINLKQPPTRVVLPSGTSVLATKK